MTLHDDAQLLLSAWAAPSTEQEQLRRDYLAHLRDHPDATSRNCLPDHVTASALVVDSGGRVLLVLHRRIGRWLQTGGHCEPADTSLAAAALREAQEESGIVGLRLDPVPVLLSRHVVPCGSIQEARHLDVQFVALSATGMTPRCSAESEEVAWFDPARLPGSADASVRALVTAALERVSG